MLFDSTILACCLDEIARAALGSTIRDFRQPRRLAVVLELDLPSDDRYLTISAEAERARMHLAPIRPRESSSTYPLEAFGRKHLKGSRVTAVRQLGYDRVVRIDLEVRNPRLIDPVTAIVAELMGRHSNVLFINSVGTILEAVKHVTPELSRARTVVPHSDYQAPPTAVGRDPREATCAEVVALLSAHEDAPLGRALGQAYDGISRVLAEEVAYRAGVDVERSVAALTVAQRSSVAEALVELMAQVRMGRWRPVVFEARHTPQHYAFPLRHLENECTMKPTDSLCWAVAQHAEMERERAEAASRRSETLSAIAAALERVNRRIADLESQADPTPAAEARRRAEALAAALYTVRAGQSEARVPDLYAGDNTEVVIPLDPHRSPGENLARLFDRARRLQEAARRAPQLLHTARADRSALEECLRAAADAQDAQTLEAIRRRAEQHGARPGRGTREGGRGSSFPSRQSSDGYELLYGRTAEESDRLLREVAAPDDWWLHARDHRGGHVIIRTHRQPDRVPRRTIEEAARLAAFLSKARHSSLVPVDYTLRKYVRRARKGPPGLHHFERERTLMVSPLRGADEGF